MKLPEKEYYFLRELPAAWNCSINDLFHYVIRGQLRIGVRLSGEIIFGVNDEPEIIGVYAVTGIVTPPKVCAEQWEGGDDKPCSVFGFGLETDYPPEILEASYMVEETLGSPIIGWKPERNWKNPETDISQIRTFMRGHDTPITISKESIVVHAVERKRFESANELNGKLKQSGGSIDSAKAGIPKHHTDTTPETLNRLAEAKPTQSEESNKKQSDCILNVPQSQDDWFYTIQKAARDFQEEKGHCPNEKDLWSRLWNNPPTEEKIIQGLDRYQTKALLWGGDTDKPLTHDGFRKRWTRYTKSN